MYSSYMYLSRLYRYVLLLCSREMVRFALAILFTVAIHVASELPLVECKFSYVRCAKTIIVACIVFVHICIDCGRYSKRTINTYIDTVASFKCL